ncbi:MAG: Bax inhibitor-1 family protein [Gemmatimonadota bacterium]|nr:Bax inhibitor-1 family protein [Gemmatimonadota bacterium]
MGVSSTVATTTVVRTGAERATLVRRAYSLLFAGILVTMASVAFARTQPALVQLVAAHPFLTFLGVIAPLYAALSVGRAFPANIGFFGLFTVAEGVWLTPFLLMYEQMQPGVLTQAGALTLGTFGTLTAYAFYSKRDFSAWGSFFGVGLFVLLGTMLLNAFFGSGSADLWIAAVGLLVFSGLTVYRTWTIRNLFGPEDYVPATISLYLSLLNMFLFMLQLLSGGRRR